MYLIKHGELRNQSASVEMISAQNVNEIIYGCCAYVGRGEQNEQLHVGCSQDDQQL